MVCKRPLGLILLVTLTTWAWCSPITTSRSPPSKQQTTNINVSSIDVLDVRTPPKIKHQQKLKNKPHHHVMENSHPGIAIPIDDQLSLDETTKKMNFYKLEKPTTVSGLSTWILLSGQITTTPTSVTTTIKSPTNVDESVKGNFTLVVNEKINRINKPVFKKRVTTTTGTTPSTSTTTEAEKNNTITTTPKTLKLTSKPSKSKISENNSKKNNTDVEKSKKPIKTSNVISTTENSLNSNASVNSLRPEAKNEETELNNNDGKKKKNNSNKRKKNKNRRRKPTTNSDVIKPVKQEKIATQLYNYLAREIMPTVGAGLVSLMVTAGLATYFLYPFGAAKRSDDIDRKDKNNNYFYTDDYSSGILEEDAIGRVIAGMPVNTLTKSSTTKSPYFNRLVDRRANIQPFEGFVKGSVEAVPLSGNEDYHYKKFVVGNVPKEFENITPVSVPEHGPRQLRITEKDAVVAYGPRNLRRRKRNSDLYRKNRSGISNEINGDVDVDYSTTVSGTSVSDSTSTTPTTTITTTPVTSTSPTTVVQVYKPDTFYSLIEAVRDLLHFKVNLGLGLLQNVTQSLSRHISKIRTKLEDQYMKRHASTEDIENTNFNKKDYDKKPEELKRNKRNVREHRSGILNEIDDNELDNNINSGPTKVLDLTPMKPTKVKNPPAYDAFLDLFYSVVEQSLQWVQRVANHISLYITKVQKQLEKRKANRIIDD